VHALQVLKLLTEDEVLFRDTVRQFADESIRPHVKEMDEKGVFEHSSSISFSSLA
jgi:alkylation response protein AidB-like acyl-CoA dehydrogenase